MTSDGDRKNTGTVFLITADHGGPLGGFVHSAAQDPGNFTIPMIVHDPSWTISHDLYDLNPDRTDPRSDENPPLAIRTLDVANLVTHLLGYEPVVVDGLPALRVR